MRRFSFTLAAALVAVLVAGLAFAGGASGASGLPIERNDGVAPAQLSSGLTDPVPHDMSPQALLTRVDAYRTVAIYCGPGHNNPKQQCDDLLSAIDPDNRWDTFEERLQHCVCAVMNRSLLTRRVPTPAQPGTQIPDTPADSETTGSEPANAESTGSRLVNTTRTIEPRLLTWTATAVYARSTHPSSFWTRTISSMPQLKGYTWITNEGLAPDSSAVTIYMIARALVRDGRLYTGAAFHLSSNADVIYVVIDGRHYIGYRLDA